MREKVNKKCEVFIRTIKIFSYARHIARCTVRVPAVDMDLKVEVGVFLKMHMQLKLCMNLEVPMEVMVKPDLEMELLLETDMLVKLLMPLSSERNINAARKPSASYESDCRQ